VAVNADAGCAWTASEAVGWVTITGGAAGSGNGTVTYTVGENLGLARSAALTIADQTHNIYQDPAPTGGSGDTEPTAWSWTVTLGGTTVVTSEEQNFSHVFEAPGQYQVSLRASNCVGSDQTTQTLVVEEPPVPPVIIPGAYIVPSAVHAPGLNDTEWRTDIRVFNPMDEAMYLKIEYRPEDTDNTVVDSRTITIQLDSRGTFAYDDILQAIPGIITNDDPGEAFSGSLSISYYEDQDGDVAAEIPPMIVSRTYTQTPQGTYGQFVPAEPDLPAEDASAIHLTGLVHNLYYRTNVRLANKGTEPAWVSVRLYGHNGESVGDPVVISIEPRSTTQINGIAEVAGHPTFLDVFSAQVSSQSNQVAAWASVIDNTTQDPVLYTALKVPDDAETLWIPGVAHVGGLNDSEWRSDFSFYNDEGDPVTAKVEFVPSNGEFINTEITIHSILPETVRYYVDIIAERFLPGWIDEALGYFVVTGVDGSALPNVAGITYNKNPTDGGTFGQNLFVFEESDLLVAGTEGYIPGVAISSDPSTGFRTNIGLLNTDDGQWSELTMTFLDEDGQVLGEPAEISLWPGRFVQPNLATQVGLSGVDAVGSVVIEIVSGGSVAAYASVVDNQTQDPVLIPASPELIIE